MLDKLSYEFQNSTLLIGISIIIMNIGGSYISKEIPDYIEEIIPQDCALRFDRGNIVNDLSQKLEVLLSEHNNIETLQEKINNIAPKILQSWNNRIDEEINLIIRSVN